MLRVGASWAARALTAALVLLALIAAAAFLSLRFWLLPNVDSYRPAISRLIAEAAGTPVTIGHIEGEWRGLRPSLTLTGVEIQDARKKPALVLQNVRGVVSWWALISGKLRFHRLEIEQPVVSLRRDERGRLFLAGIEIQDDPRSEEPSFGNWLLDQANIVVKDATISWQDARLENATLVLTRLQATFMELGKGHKFDITAQPPADVAKTLSVSGQLDGAVAAHVLSWAGEVSARVSGADVATLRRYVRLPNVVMAGKGEIQVALRGRGAGSAQAIAQVDLKQVVAQLRDDAPALEFSKLSGRFVIKDLNPGFELRANALDVTLAGGGSKLPASDFVVTIVPPHEGKLGRGSIDTTQVELSGLWAVLNTLPLDQTWNNRLSVITPSGTVRGLALSWQSDGSSPSKFSLKCSFENVAIKAFEKVPGLSGVSGTLQASDTGGSLRLSGKNVILDVPKVFWEPLRFGNLEGAATWKMTKESVSVTLDHLKLANDDFSGVVRSQYRSMPGTPGWIDLTAQLDRADGRGTHKYLPRFLREPFKRWLQSAIVAGTSDDVSVTLRGNLFDFPFVDEKTGLFEVKAKVTGGVLDYVSGWPKIEGIEGDLLFRGRRMEITATRARVFSGAISQARAVIPQLDSKDPLLEITGRGIGPLADGLRFISESPLRQIGSGALDPYQGTGNMKLALKLLLPIARLGETKVDGVVELAGNSIDDGPGGGPGLTRITGKLGFTEKGLSSERIAFNLLGGPAFLRISTDSRTGMRAEGSGKASAEEIRAHFKHRALRYASGVVDWSGGLRFAEGRSTLNISAAMEVLGKPAKFTVTRVGAEAITVEGAGSTTPQALAREFGDAAAQYLSGDIDWKTKVRISGQKTDAEVSARTEVLGGPAQLQLVGLEDPQPTLRAQGELTLESLRRRFEQPLLGQLAGTMRWTGTMGLGDQSPVRISSDLVGVDSRLPAPLNKRAEAAMPVTVDAVRNADGKQLVKLKLAGMLSSQLVFQTAQGKSQLLGAEVALGGEAQRPDREGIWVAGNLGELDLDQWRLLLKAGKEDPGTPSVSGINATIGKMTLFGRSYSNFKLAAIHQQGVWDMQLNGDQINGRASWEPQASSGILRAQLRTFVIPALTPARAQNASAVLRQDDAPLVTDAGAGRYPSMDVVAEDFRIAHRKLGKLEVLAYQQGQDWRMEKVNIVNPHGKFTADGIWQGWLKRPQTSLRMELSVTDLGNFLGDIGYPNTVKRGTANVKGTLHWSGEAFAFDPPTMGGEFSVVAKSGQFLKTEPGVAKLLGLLSLQSLPRRIILDFRDVFSSGFAFDEINGTVQTARGVLSTKDFTMSGSAATVAMSGDADLAGETQNLMVKVTPSLGGTVAVAGAVAGGPVTGVAAYVLQKVLRNPIDKLFSFEYRITGKWEDPIVAKVSPVSSGRPVLKR
jgi:uncharacterized protein YhdP